jgi:hypothetical protein
MSYFLHKKSAALEGHLYLLPRNSKKYEKGTERLTLNTMQRESGRRRDAATGTSLAVSLLRTHDVRITDGDGGEGA